MAFKCLLMGGTSIYLKAHKSLLACWICKLEKSKATLPLDPSPIYTSKLFLYYSKEMDWAAKMQVYELLSKTFPTIVVTSFITFPRCWITSFPVTAVVITGIQLINQSIGLLIQHDITMVSHFRGGSRCVYVCMYVYARMRVCVCACVCVRLCVCVRDKVMKWWSDEVMKWWTDELIKP